jgi:hypothetical protein
MPQSWYYSLEISSTKPTARSPAFAHTPSSISWQVTAGLGAYSSRFAKTKDRSLKPPSVYMRGSYQVGRLLAGFDHPTVSVLTFCRFHRLELNRVKFDTVHLSAIESMEARYTRVARS